MAILTKEFREHFLSLEGITLIGLNAQSFPEEQDIPTFNKTVTVGGIVYPTIFKKDGLLEPVFSDNVWLKFTKSIAFKLNQDDRAVDSDSVLYYQNFGLANEAISQGLVTLATDVEAKAWNNGVETLYSRVPRVSQLPDADVEINQILTSVDFQITLIPANPNNGIVRRIDPAEDERNRFLFKLSDNYIDWLRDAFDAVKLYVDGVDVSPAPTSVTVNGVLGGGGSSIQVVDNPATATSTHTFIVSLNITPDTSITLGGGGSSNNIIPSQLAVKTYVDALAATIAGFATAADLTTLLTRVNTMEGGASPQATLKANQTALDALALLVDRKLFNDVDDIMDGTLTMTSGNHVIVQQDPTLADHLARKAYVDAQIDSRVAVAGDTMTGLLILSGDAVAPLGAATKQQVDAKVAKAGDIMTGFLTLNANPTATLHAATKGYVDTEIGILLALITTLQTQVADLIADKNAGLNVLVNLKDYSSLNLRNGRITGYNA